MRYRLRHSRFAFVASASAAIALSAVAHSQPLLLTDFESPNYTPGNLIGQKGWTGSFASGSTPATISTDRAVSGTQSVKIDANQLLGSSAIFWTSTPSALPPPNRRLLVSANVWAQSDALTRSDIWGFAVFDAQGGAIAAAGLDFAGRPKVTDTTGTFTLASGLSFAGDQWHSLTMLLDFDARTFSLSVDGNTMATSRPFISSAGNSLGDADLFVGGPLFDVAYYDDLSVIAVPVPAPGATSVLAITGALAVRRRRSLTVRYP